MAKTRALLLRFGAPVFATAVALGALTAVPAAAADGPRPATAIETGLAPEASEEVPAKPWLSIRILNFRLTILEFR